MSEVQTNTNQSKKRILEKSYNWNKQLVKKNTMAEGIETIKWKKVDS